MAARAKNSIAVETLRELLSYDPRSGELTWKPRERKWFPNDQSWKTWNTRYAGKPALASSLGNGYRFGAILGKNFLSHRVAYAMHHGRWPDYVDHIDGVRGNNAITNLRSVTRSGNMRNAARARSNTSGCTGVFWSEGPKRWCATIKQNGKIIHLGQFRSKDEAIACRKSAEPFYGFHPNHGSVRPQYKKHTK